MKYTRQEQELISHVYAARVPCVETAFSPTWVAKSEISDRSDDQRKLRTLIFLPDDHRDQDPRAGRSHFPPLRYREAEFSDEGHQERLGLHEAVLMGRMSFCNVPLDLQSMTHANLQPIHPLSPTEKVSLGISKIGESGFI